jgi:hypothetical protein
MASVKRRNLDSEPASLPGIGLQGHAEFALDHPGMPIAKKRTFGQDARVACATCGEDTYLRRRLPHLEGEYELQTFACRGCKSSTTRIVDAEGRPAFGLG